MRLTYSYDTGDAVFASDALDIRAGREVTLTAFGQTSIATVVSVTATTSIATVVIDLPDDSAVARAMSAALRSETSPQHSSALGLPPGLRTTGKPGQRVLSSPGGLAELLEREDGQWADQWSTRSWQGWQRLAMLILDTRDPA